MGQKTHPIGFRLGIKHTWRSKWFSSKQYKDFLHEDLKVRRLIEKKLKHAGLSLIEVERSLNEFKVSLHVSRPGVVIGRAGSGLELLRKELEKIIHGKVQIKAEEVKKPNLSARIIVNEIAGKIEKRMRVKRAIAQAVEKVILAGADGVRVECKGRIDGADVARREKMSRGLISLQSLEKNIDYALQIAQTKYGTIGVKVWISKKQDYASA